MDNDGIIISVKDYAPCSNPQLKASDDLIYSVIIQICTSEDCLNTVAFF